MKEKSAKQVTCELLLAESKRLRALAHSLVYGFIPVHRATLLTFDENNLRVAADMLNAAAQEIEMVAGDVKRRKAK